MMKLSKDLGIYLFVIFAAIFIYVLINNIQAHRRKDRRILSPDYDILADAADEIYENPDIKRYKDGKIPESTASALLYYAMQSEDKTKRIKAALACGKTPDIYSTPYLIQLLKDPNLEVRETGKRALKQIWNQEYNVDEWQEFWEDKNRNKSLFGKVVSVIFIIAGWFIFISNIVKKKYKPYTIVFAFILTFWGYTGGFSHWFITKVVHVNGNSIYYEGAWYHVALISYEKFLVARIAQVTWIVIGVGLLAFGIWQGIRYIRRRWYGNSNSETRKNQTGK